MITVYFFKDMDCFQIDAIKKNPRKSLWPIRLCRPRLAVNTIYIFKILNQINFPNNKDFFLTYSIISISYIVRFIRTYFLNDVN